MNKEEREKKLNKIHNKQKKLKDLLDFSELSTYELVKTVVKINRDFPNITVEKYIEAIKKPELKEILFQIKKLEDEWWTLFKSGCKNEDEENSPRTEARQKP